METDKTPQEQWSALNKNEAHAPETDDQSSMDRIPTTKGNNTTPGSSADDSGKPNREGETKKSSEKSVTQSKTEDMQAPSSSNLEQESSNASAPHAKKDVDRAIHADGVINPKTEPINSKSLLTEAEPCNNNEKNNLAVPNDTSSNQINGNLNLPGQNQNTKMISHEILNKDEYRESKFTEHVARNEIRTDTEGSEDNDNNMRQDTKVDKIDEMPSSLTQSTEYSSIGKERDHEPSNDKQTNLTGIKRNQLSQGQTQSKSINDTTDMDRQDGDVKTETDKSTDKENYQDGLNRSESTKRENSEMVSEYDQIGDMQLADVTATDEKIEQDTLCQLNAKPRVRAEGPHDDSFRPKQQASEDAQLLSKQENSRIGDSEDEASPFINVFESLGEDMEIIQKDELEKEKKLSSTLEEERKIDPKNELEKEKKLSSKQREAYQREIENMKATLQQQEEEREAYQREIENMKATLQQQEEQREANQREIEQMKTTLQQQEEDNALMSYDSSTQTEQLSV